MIKSITIKNFRCFQELEIRDLASVNIISGKNSVGKTSLLEAIFLSIGSHNPNLPLMIDGFRGVTHVDLNAEEIWGWLFHNHNTHSEIRIDCRYSNNNSSVLRVYLAPREETAVPQQKLIHQPSVNSDSSPLANPSQQLTMEYAVPEQPLRVATAWVEDGKLRQSNAENKGIVGHFLSSRAIQLNENPDRFSKLKQKRDEKRMLESLRLIEPRLLELTVLVQGGKPVVAGDVGLDQFVPVSYMGEGFNKLLSIVLGIASFPGGVILIDEIENGFHHSVLPDLWRVVFDMSKRYKTQLFVSTHSIECIQAAYEVSSEDSDQCCAFHRLERSEDRIFSVTLASESLKNAFESNLEIR